MTMSEPANTCPKCKTEFPLKDSLAREIELMEQAYVH